jgi:hypothetical protein
MTTTQNQAPAPQENHQKSLPLLADSAALLRVRVLPAEFARLIGVSKQSVSRWIADGKITINALDGRLDVQAATEQLLRTSDPGRMRSRVLKAAVLNVSELRQTAAAADDSIAAIQAELDAARASYADLEERYIIDGDASDRFIDLVRNGECLLRATADLSEWREVVDQMEAEASAEALAAADLDDKNDAAEAAALCASDPAGIFQCPVDIDAPLAAILPLDSARSASCRPGGRG